MALKDLNVRQQIRVYVGDTYWSPPAAPMAAAAPEPEPAPAPEPEPAPVVLPTTAGSLGWLAVIGTLFLVLGGALRVARQR